ncbi:MAG: pseudouridine-5-phosphate glycosidase [Treponema sp. GWB1_62_6]|nr:MAG: pseudouridine-5-phosphate glycosidase [Treponema sp. GWC1_61_84]OHE70491.1 MAG: pseudouridine-5-phosphate glycosidase [Treponema sp. RIFOXYC1_FULL_61_9]OHE72071.1 MAG: pseudouridine-5-phosphate glycosidase [Treponema sp. GWB1_62_6]HCM27944.1 pseudouridine-5-phosphate glycosidase [Treponema sp.]
MNDRQALRGYLDFSEEVEAAVAEGRPVVALESTIISHGMPWPRNAETALRVEAAVRERGATPATIAVIGGRLKAGLSPEGIEKLAKAGQSAIKTSRRDLPFVVADGADGATTVAATMIVADLAGIRVFATGGIGGVHRGATETFDVSADLEELAHTDVAVVCAGAKSILDLGLTLEYLETRGVPVVGWGTEELPAFYSRYSGHKLDRRIDSVRLLARAMLIKWKLGLRGGIVVANPIPAEYAMGKAEIDAIIERALGEAADLGIKGKEITPFLLARISELSGGESLDSNIRLVLNNAALAADLAVAYAGLLREDSEENRP